MWQGQFCTCPQPDVKFSFCVQGMMGEEHREGEYGRLYIVCGADTRTECRRLPLSALFCELVCQGLFYKTWINRYCNHTQRCSRPHHVLSDEMLAVSPHGGGCGILMFSRRSFNLLSEMAAQHMLCFSPVSSYILKSSPCQTHSDIQTSEEEHKPVL